MKTTIRRVLAADIPALKAVLNSIELFPAEMLDEMIADYLDNPQTEAIWFTALAEEIPIAIGFCAPEELTEGTYNLYAIGVKQDLQGQGIGKQLMHFLEAELQQQGARILIVDTSGTPAFDKTRQFYEGLDYTKEAVIRDFWKEGDDKVVYWKKL